MHAEQRKPGTTTPQPMQPCSCLGHPPQHRESGAPSVNPNWSIVGLAGLFGGDHETVTFGEIGHFLALWTVDGNAALKLTLTFARVGKLGTSVASQWHLCFISDYSSIVPNPVS